MIGFSFLKAAAIIATGSTTFVDVTHPASYVLTPSRPFRRAYSADLSGQRLTLDLGAPTSLAVIALLHANFATALIQGDNSDSSWGAPAYSQAITLNRSGNERYQHAFRPSAAVPFNYRYLSISIPTQSSTDGFTKFALGGIWPGLSIVSPPWDILTDPEETKLEARKDIETEDGRKLQRIKYDDPMWAASVRRLARTEADLAAWREIDRLWSAAPGQAALVMMRASYAEETYLMRQISNSKFKHSLVWSESEMELLEVTTG